MERTYTIPLRKEFQKAPSYKRAKKAIKAIREFMQRHMKSENILIGPKLNLKIWENGIKNPPKSVKVNAVKDKEETVRVELFGFDFKKKEKSEKSAKPTGIAGKLQEKLGGKEEKVATEMKSGKKELKKADAKAKEAEKKATTPKVEKTTPESDSPVSDVKKE